MKDVIDDKRLFNIDILVIPKSELKSMGEVTSLAMFESNSRVPDPNGLFSIDIFGPIGSTMRLTKPGYIDLRVPIIHPLVYKHLRYVNKLFDNIMAGKTKAVFNTKERDFIEDSKGETGFEFFMSHLEDINLDKYYNNSKQTESKLDLIKRGISQDSLIQEFIVIPAGIRDFGVDSKGKPIQDEINDYYRRMIMAVNSIRNVKVDPKRYSNYNAYRYKVQNIALDVFEYIKNLLDNKKGFIQGKWASRSILGGTRNVITANTTIIKDLKDPHKIGFNDTIIGIYQFIKATSALSMYGVLKRFILGNINPYNNSAKVIDINTLKTTHQQIDTKTKEGWLTRNGLNKMFSKVKQDVAKDEPVKIGNGYLALVYEDKDDVYIIKDTNDVPNGYDVKKARPMTYGEMLYIAVIDMIKDRRIVLTRYPVTNVGSTHPSKVYLKTTIVGRRVKVHIDLDVMDVPEYPKKGEKYLNSTVPHNTKLSVLDGDYDGDQVNVTVTYTKESQEEIDRLFKSKSFYISPDGSLTYSVKTVTLDLVVKHLSDVK